MSDKRRAALIFGLFLAVVAAVSCSSPATPDTVVAVTPRCSVLVPKFGETEGQIKTGPECDRLTHITAQLVTVKTHDGATYTAEVAPNMSVSVGSVWPPPTVPAAGLHGGRHG
jgi:hypothetical protein